MKNLNIKPFFFLLVGFSFVVLFLEAWIKEIKLEGFFEVMSLVPSVVSIDVIAYFIFSKCLWHWKYFQGWLVPFPNLTGTWLGTLQTTWKDTNGCTPGPIPAMLTINQTFGGMSCVMRTQEMESHSYLEGFNIDEAAQIRRLSYTYTSRPKLHLRDRSTPHDGSVLLNLKGSPINELEGEYWTGRKTTGSISLSFHSKKLLDSLPECASSHPMQSTAVS